MNIKHHELHSIFNFILSFWILLLWVYVYYDFRVYIYSIISIIILSMIHLYIYKLIYFIVPLDGIFVFNNVSNNPFWRWGGIIQGSSLDFVKNYFFSIVNNIKECIVRSEMKNIKIIMQINCDNHFLNFIRDLEQKWQIPALV